MDHIERSFMGGLPREFHSPVDPLGFRRVGIEGDGVVFDKLHERGFFERDGQWFREHDKYIENLQTGQFTRKFDK